MALKLCLSSDTITILCSFLYYQVVIINSLVYRQALPWPLLRKIECGKFEIIHILARSLQHLPPLRLLKNLQPRFSRGLKQGLSLKIFSFLEFHRYIEAQKNLLAKIVHDVEGPHLINYFLIWVQLIFSLDQNQTRCLHPRVQLSFHHFSFISKMSLYF